MADSAKARAEARRKAILARGGDRLARIATSARGEDGATYMNDASPLPGRTGLTNFVGETTDMPTPPASTPSSRNVSGATTTSTSSPFQAAGLGTVQPDPSVWTEQQQQDLMNALMSSSGLFPGSGSNAQPRVSSVSSSSTAVAPSSAAGGDGDGEAQDPMAAIMAALSSQQQGAPPPGLQFPGAAFSPPKPPKPKTLVQKIMPVVHMVSAWALLAYFVLLKEPEVFDEKTHGGSTESTWRRWAELGWKSPSDTWGVQTVPFFWAFTTLAIVLHTWRIFTRLDPIQPPMLLAFALPHLPPPLPAIITHGLKYLQIGGVFFDDVSALLVGTGFLIWVANWIAT